MRVGMNPMVEERAPAMPDILAVMITHLPNREGYHAQRFEVVKASIESLRSGADCNLPLYVWDNGSDIDFRAWLLREVRPEFLTLSGNRGKAQARTMILNSLPANTVVCYSDDDILYSPGWLAPQLDLLVGFPQVGMVSGCPIRTSARWGTDFTRKWALENAKVTFGRFIPDEWEQDFCHSIGRDYRFHVEYTTNDQDTLIEYFDMKAYAGAHHMQFIGYAGRIAPACRMSKSLMRNEKPFDTAVDSLNLLRLFTTGRYAQHIGNILDADLRLQMPSRA